MSTLLSGKTTDVFGWLQPMLVYKNTTVQIPNELQLKIKRYDRKGKANVKVDYPKIMKKKKIQSPHGWS